VLACGSLGTVFSALVRIKGGHSHAADSSRFPALFTSFADCYAPHSLNVQRGILSLKAICVGNSSESGIRHISSETLHCIAPINARPYRHPRSRQDEPPMKNPARLSYLLKLLQQELSMTSEERLSEPSATRPKVEGEVERW
jgi:hypothetical protein